MLEQGRKAAGNIPDISAIKKAIADFARAPHRSVAVVCDFDGESFYFGIHQDAPYAAASLLKLPLAMAIETQSKGAVNTWTQQHNLGRILKKSRQNSVLHALVDHDTITTEELLRLMLITSDEPATKMLRTLIQDDEVNFFLHANNFNSTRYLPATEFVSVSGITTAHDAVELLRLATTATKFPKTSSALKSSILNSRIPLGVAPPDLVQAHKTGSLPGVAHDVAQIHTSRGVICVAFLSSDQTDTVITGYEMGLCMQKILQACKTTATSSVSVVHDISG